MPRHITEYLLYRWRYGLGYAFVGLLVATLLVVAALYVPGGLSQAEIDAATHSSAISFTSFDPLVVIDLPYALLQRTSFKLLGVTTLSIKLPSVIIGLFSLVGIVMLLRHWFHRNVAIIAALIVITTSQFIFSSQNGTPIIMYIFIPTWLLFLALKVSRKTKRRNFWEFLLVAAVSLSLYTPLSAYVILALASATLLHPHLRYIVGRLSKKKMFGASALGLVLLSPLIMALFIKPEVGFTLLGIPDSWPDIRANATELFQTYLGFIVDKDSGSSQSAYTLPSILLFLLGLVRLFRTKHTARSYIITSWIVLLAPIVLFNPSKTTITFVPVMLLIAAGIDELLHRWYSMFPRNPYARIAGLLPMTLLVVGMALTGIERYFYAYRYNPPVATRYSDDLNLLHSELNDLREQSVIIVPTEQELQFYQAVASRREKVSVLPADAPIPADQAAIVTRGAFYKRNMGQAEPTKIITNGRSSDADRLYLYKSTEK